MLWLPGTSRRRPLDDWGPDRLNASQRRDLMEIIEDRHGRGSTLITSQLKVDKWQCRCSCRGEAGSRSGRGLARRFEASAR
jgi:hypothetical protein